MTVASLPTMMTTTEVANILNDLYDCPRGGRKSFDRKYVIEEIWRDRLVARINDRRGKRSRIRIHRDDFRVYIEQQHTRVAQHLPHAP